MVEDGEELFARFLNANQNTGEKPSNYLQRLQVLLTKVVAREGIPLADSNKQLLRQFCRGCWDQAIILVLQLEQKKSSPPSFSELLLLLRTEEDKRAVKQNRMKKHLGNSKAALHAHTAYGMSPCDSANLDSPSTKNSLSETEKLAKDVAKLQKQFASFFKKETKTADSCKTHDKSKESVIEGSSLGTGATSLKVVVNASRMPRPWFCFKCGENGHIVAQCCNDPNPAVVSQKNKELREKRDRWRAQHESPPEMSLNL